MAVIATGGRQLPALACGDEHESWAWGNPEVKIWFAATVASTALLATPGAIAVQPNIGSQPADPGLPTVPSTPLWNVLSYGGLVPIKSATLPGKISLKIPKPVRSTDFGLNCHAIAVLGCRMASGVDENRLPR